MEDSGRNKPQKSNARSGFATKNDGDKDKKINKRRSLILFILLFLLLSAICVGIYLYRCYTNSNKEITNEEYAKIVYEEALQRSDYYGTESDYAMGLEVFDVAKLGIDDDSRLAYLYVAEASYASSFGRFKHGRDLLNENVVKSYPELLESCFYKEVDYDISFQEGNYEKANEIKKGDCFNEEENYEEE